jgi:antirestriction protein
VRTATYQRTLEPQIYVASLSDYNDGELHGAWIDLDGKDVDDIQEEITAMLEKSPFASSAFARKHGMTAEEYAIHDHSGFGGLAVSEWTSVEELVSMAEMISEHGLAGAAFLQHADDYGWKNSEFSNRYLSQWPSFADFAEELFDDTNHDALVAAAKHSYLSVNYERFARDIAGDYATVGSADGVYVFDASY